MSTNEGDSIKIFLRVRPPEPGSCEGDFATKVVGVNTTDNSVLLRTKPEPKVFRYDDVGDADITQEAVFSVVGKKIIESCIAGYNGTIFAYGQTGSGKTFTMLGPSENADSFHHELRGVIPRSFEYIFQLITQQQKQSASKKEFLCRCSFLEIYQEQIFDLLDPTSEGLHLRESLQRGVFVDGLIEKVVCSPGDAFQVLNRGWLNRRVAATSMNRESSRSHAVFTLNIESKDDVHGVQTIRRSCLNLVDLAGSERQKDTNTRGVHLKEAGSINRSLHVLGNVITSLVDLSHGRKRHIPYRDSKLTFLLRDSLGGNAKTRVVACIHPDSRCFGETLSTLNFARSAKMIKNKAVVNEDFHGSHVELQNEICRLKEEVKSLQNAHTVHYTPVFGNSPTEADMSADSAWKKHFIEAMYFREASEKEKKGLLETVTHLQELCDKKDKYNQSTKMIIKFRDNAITNLQKRVQSGSDETEMDNMVKCLKEEIKLLRQQLECNPQLAKYSGENKNLRNELEQLKTKSSLTDVLCNENLIDELEKLYRELKLSKEAGASSALNSLRESPSKEKRLTEAVEKHKGEVKGYQREIETLKQSLHDFEKKSESQLMEMNIELVSSRKIIAELENALEAQQMKARAERDLHCQTLKMITTPTHPSSRKVSVTPTLNRSDRKDPLNLSFPNESFHSSGEGIMEVSMPNDEMESAHEALLEEKHAEIERLQQTVDEKESELLKLRQEVDKKDLHINQHKTLLEKERSEFSSRSDEFTSMESSLKDKIETLERDFKFVKEENIDLHLVLKSADKQLKDEKEMRKNCQQTSKLEKQTFETQLAHKSLELDKITRDSDETLKELASVKEDLETTLTTKSFFENRAEEIEKAFHQEVKIKEKLLTQLETMKSAEDVAELERSWKGKMDEAWAKLEAKDLELNGLQKHLLEKDGIVAESKEVLQTTLTTKSFFENRAEEIEKAFHQEVKIKEKLLTQLETMKSAEDVAELERSWKGKMDEAWAKLEAKDLELNGLQKHLLEKDGIVAESKDIISNLMNNMQEMKTNLSELQGSCSVLKSENASLTQELDEIRKDLERKSNDVAFFEKELKNCKEIYEIDLQKKDFEIANLQEDQDSLNESIFSLEQTLDKERNENQEHDAKVKQLQSLMEDLKAKNKLQEMEIRHAQHHAAQENSVRESISSFKSVSSEKIRSLELLLNARDRELESLQQIQAENRSLMERFGKMQEEEGEKEKEMSRLRGELEYLHTLKLRLDTELQKEREEKAKLIGHSNHLQKIKLMEKKNMEIQELSKRYNDLAEEHARCKLDDITNKK